MATVITNFSAVLKFHMTPSQIKDHVFRSKCDSEFPTVISVTRFAIGSSLPERVCLTTGI